MYNIRYYDEKIHPDHFKGGLRGLVIRALNWVRWTLETVVQKLVLKELAKRGGLPRMKVKTLLDTFKLDVRAESLEKDQKSPLLEVEEPPPPRAERYRQARPSKILEMMRDDQGLPERPKPLDNLVGQYAFNSRAKHYARGRRFLTSDPDGDFEPLEQKSGTLDFGGGRLRVVGDSGDSGRSISLEGIRVGPKTPRPDSEGGGGDSAA